MNLVYSWSSRPGEQFVGLPKCLEGAGQKKVGCWGGRAPVGAARAALGGGGSREPCATILTVMRNHACLELLLRLHATHLAVMGKKQGCWQAARTLSGVPIDSIACDNLVWLY